MSKLRNRLEDLSYAGGWRCSSFFAGVVGWFAGVQLFTEQHPSNECVPTALHCVAGLQLRGVLFGWLGAGELEEGELELDPREARRVQQQQQQLSRRQPPPPPRGYSGSGRGGFGGRGPPPPPPQRQYPGGRQGRGGADYAGELDLVSGQPVPLQMPLMPLGAMGMGMIPGMGMVLLPGAGRGALGGRGARF